ncbi:hypothetical protein HHK36_003401 [Tetracentron sinense]|uniref:DEK-C domain-containing protein n=1 Tax=Tetracentron sinense TaxID=13715 RepID=A0A834ZN51_TETSI|nr:hypothetical protein HHK36_003401 [Tetracentron sinense]
MDEDLIQIYGFCWRWQKIGFGFSSIPFTFTTLILSTVLLITFTKQRPILKEKAKENLQEMEVLRQKISLQNEAAKQENCGVGQIDNFLVRSTNEDSEVEWPFPRNVGQTSEYSDDSISDDDSLIEIALPSGHYVCPREEQKLKSRPNCPEFLPESIFPQQGLMELLAEINEMNEEENLIEIDISIGSIKCSRCSVETLSIDAWNCGIVMVEVDTVTEAVEASGNGICPPEDPGELVTQKKEDKNGVKEMEEDSKEDEKAEAVKIDEDNGMKEKKKCKEEEEKEEPESVKMDEDHELKEDDEESKQEGEEEEKETVKMEEEYDSKENKDIKEKVEEKVDDWEEKEKAGETKRGKRSKKRGKGRSFVEKEGVKKKKVEDKKAKEPNTPVASSLDRPVRERKSVERLVASFEKETVKEFRVEKGRGTPLKDIPNGVICNVICLFAVGRYCDQADRLSSGSSCYNYRATCGKRAGKGRKRKREVKSSASKSGGTPAKRSVKTQRKREETLKGKETKSEPEKDESAEEEKEEESENGVPHGSENEAHEHSESEEKKDESEEESEEDTGKHRRSSKKPSSKKESATKTKTKRLKISKKSSPAASPKKTPIKSSSKHSKVDDRSDTSPRVFSRKKKNEEAAIKKSSTPMKSASKEKVTKEKTGKRVSKGKEKIKEEDSKPSEDELKNAICEILKEVDFNTATFTDILKKLARRFDTDLTTRKSSIKLMIQEELTKLADEAEEDEGEEDEGDEGQ